MHDQEIQSRARAGRARGRAAIAVLASGALVGVAVPALALGASVTAKPISGASYVAHPFTGDPFELRVAPGGRTAKFVGKFVYSDPGCPTAPSGNEYLTADNAPSIEIATDGSFSGQKTNGAYLDKIYGTFEGKNAPTTFVETIPGCQGDKPQVFSFTMHTSASPPKRKSHPKRGATPKPGCYGTCGGDEGPVGGFFIVPADRKQVQDFGYEDKCLGIRSIPQPVGPPARVGYGLELPNMRIRRGTFGLTGVGKVYSDAAKPTHVRVVLNGIFKTSQEAVVTLSVSHPGCSTTRLRIKDASS